MTRKKFIGWTAALAVISFVVAGVGYPLTMRVAARVDAWAANVIDRNPCPGKPITYNLTSRRTEINPSGSCQVRIVIEDHGVLQLFTPGGNLIRFMDGTKEVTSLRRNQFLGMKEGQAIAFAASETPKAEVTVTLCPSTAPAPSRRDAALWKGCTGS